MFRNSIYNCRNMPILDVWKSTTPTVLAILYTIQCTARRVLDENINMYSTEAYPTHEGQQLPAGQLWYDRVELKVKTINFMRN